MRTVAETLFDEDPDYPREVWKSEVVMNVTELGYWDWAREKRDQKELDTFLEAV